MRVEFRGFRVPGCSSRFLRIEILRNALGRGCPGKDWHPWARVMQFNGFLSVLSPVAVRELFLPRGFR